MLNRVGPPVRGEDFYGREAFVGLVWQKVQAGHVLLAAPRRFGKTSVMYSLIDEPRHNFRIVHVDLQPLDEPAQLLTELIVKLSSQRGFSVNLPGLGEAARKVLSKVQNTLDEVELFEIKLKLREQTQQAWPEIGEALFAQLAASHHPMLFILDELPMMLDRMARSPEHRPEAKSLLRWLRRLRVAPEMQNLHFLVAGSIGIDYVLHDLGEITAINDFERLRLDPFPLKVAGRFLEELSQSHALALSPACRSKIFQLVGEPVPYFLQIIFSEILKSHAQNGEKPTPARIERLYHERVLGVDCKSYFDHYYGRLREYYKPQEEKAIKRLLRELAVIGRLSRPTSYALYRETLARRLDVEDFNSVMTNLENDFYITQDTATGDYRFACKLLRDWWLRHYGLAV